MRIPASRFSTLPEGCPVQAGALSGHCGAVATEGRYWFHWPGSREPIEVLPEDMLVDLSTPAAIRAFAPALIVAVRFPEGRYNDSRFPPMPLRDLARDTYTLIGYILDSGALCAYMPRHELVTGATPEEALLNGLKAALDAACVAVGGAP